MAWTITHDVDIFHAAVDGFLRGDPVRNTVTLTVVEALRVQGPGDVLFGWWTDGGRPAGTVLGTAGFPPMLSPMPERAARDLADALAGRDMELPGINGSPATAEAFAKAWTDATGAASNASMEQRLYRLDRLIVPDPPPDGAPRVAVAADREVALDWYEAFARSGPGHGPVDAAALDRRIAEGRLILWEVGGRPVAMAGRTPIIAGMARIAPVYTPPENRRRGYAAAVTAAVTRSAQDAGAAHVVLFTDLANPTSNGVYHRLGYRQVEDRIVLTFT
ncbi:GNAT family N-acetyltransferase [Actinomadura decatromicini]|uniref:GNAT family N-acetyltransferase n=1 Tax=Actinomadura decatromicini TaxID=2604572 RepID=A0A5D3FFS2_9ACTN|nr:GNAT family N-acetyltransferase [Actinomadura decatromicini]TYK47767.1 GNAT family N-acetyltransferase [Actinomadura decatromicini]